MSTNSPGTPSFQRDPASPIEAAETATADAVRAVRAFLRSFGFDNAALLDRLSRSLAAELEAPAMAGPRAIREALEARVTAWLVPHFEPMPREQLFARVRFAFLSCGATRHWPEAFLLTEVPEAMVRALRSALPAPTPLATPSAMPEQSLAPATWILRLQQLWSSPESGQAHGSWNSRA